MATTAPATPEIVASDLRIEPQAMGRMRSGAARIDSIDRMRGLVIAIMVLDHVRDFFHVEVPYFDPVDPDKTYLLLYLTRWITHLCAPTFVLLAGVSIWMQRDKGKTGATLSGFLLSRGLWLVFLELTVISFAWNFGPPPAFNLQVIWAIGWSMVIMALLARLPSRVVLGVGLAFSLLYPLLIVAVMGMPGPANPPSLPMQLAFVGGYYGPLNALILYPVLPWTGIMAIGFGLGPLFAMEAERRRRWLVGLGLGLLAVFLGLRLANGYGDPVPWRAYPDAVQTGMSFFNVLKYPPVPDYIAVTLGLSMLLFVAIERLRGWVGDVLLDFGRTPLFTYICHLYIIHGAMLVAAIATGQANRAIGWLVQAGAGPPPTPWGVPLWGVYLIWLAVLGALVPLARWMAGIKRRRRDWWLGFL